MTPQAAETLALEALGWLAADADRLGPFMAEAGVVRVKLRARAGGTQVELALSRGRTPKEDASGAGDEGDEGR
ncbi:MAG: DUF3572 family protein [Pseudomonadota bacterium]